MPDPDLIALQQITRQLHDCAGQLASRWADRRDAGGRLPDLAGLIENLRSTCDLLTMLDADAHPEKRH